MSQFDSLSIRVSDLDKVFSGEHLYHTWQALGCPDRSPTPQEAIRHWICHAEPYRPQTFYVWSDFPAKGVEIVSDETCATEGGESLGGLAHNSRGRFLHEATD